METTEVKGAKKCFKEIKNNLRDRDYRLTDESDVKSVGLDGEDFRPGTQASKAATCNSGPTQTASIRHIRRGEYEHRVTRHE